MIRSGPMPWFTFYTYPLWLNLLLFALAAGAVWLAGSRLSTYADLIADRTGLGQAFVGVVLLAGATELPEMATTATAGLGGNAPLAVSNLFGGIALQTAILAAADAAAVRGALTFFTPRPVLLLQGMLLVVLLALTLAAVVAGEFVTLLGVGLSPALLLGGYLLAIFLLHRYQGHERWQPVDEPHQADSGEAGHRERYRDWSTGRLARTFAAASAAILVAGVILAQTAEALAQQTGLGASFIGATLLASSTSLPELSTSIAAARLGAYSLAVSNIFGSNMIMVALLLPADIFYRQGPILATVDRSAMFTVTAGIVVTAVYVIGLIEQRDKAVLRMGYDSLAVLALYLGHLLVLFRLR